MKNYRKFITTLCLLLCIYNVSSQPLICNFKAYFMNLSSCELCERIGDTVYFRYSDISPLENTHKYPLFVQITGNQTYNSHLYLSKDTFLVSGNYGYMPYNEYVNILNYEDYIIYKDFTKFIIRFTFFDKNQNILQTIYLCISLTLKPNFEPYSFLAKVYPNPVRNILTIENVADAAILIYSITGQLVKSEENSNGNVQIDMSEMAAGLYIVVIYVFVIRNGDVQEQTVNKIIQVLK